MNRLGALLPTSVGTDQRVGQQSRQRVAERQFRLDFPYRLFIPEGYEPGYRYPLVIWFHSEHSSEWELDQVVPHLSLRNYVLAAIRGTERSPKGPRLFDWDTSPESLSLIDQMLAEVTSECQNSLSIDPQRRFLVGCGKGGTLAALLALRAPREVAGAVCLDGDFPDQPGMLSDFHAARKIPMLLASTCGGADANPRPGLKAGMRLAHRSGLRVQPMQFVGQSGLTVDMLAATNRFIMQCISQPNELAQPTNPSQR
jgi:phospholipase/carboxylesterase